MLEPGTVVVVDFPGAVQTKRRPALVVSTTAYHAATPDATLAVLTSQTADATGPTDYILVDWVTAGLTRETAFRAFLNTLPRSAITKIVGKLSDTDWAEVQARLRIALAVT
jgi:mRNA interferase MazF